MSSEIAIKVERLSKCYQIYEHPRDRLKQFVLPRFQRMAGRQPRNYYREFRALDDVSFEIGKGETVGIIGRNGSGKSTLLQMICGTLNPTGGAIQTNGRIAALLELGSGFNPEFTGRENVYMNGAVLGLETEQIDARFEDIAAFADIGDFIEQPVKTYSSGMMVRLAFSVIAHVDADILVVDEALAVGDAVFTQKCMRFLRRFMETGTVLFVSHDTGAVSNLCRQAIWLNRGAMQMRGSASDVTEAYLEYCAQEIYGDSVRLNSVRSGKAEHGYPVHKVEKETKIRFYEDIANSDGWTTGAAEIRRVSVMRHDGSPVVTLSGGESLLLKIEVVARNPLASPIVGFFVKDRLGQSLFGEHTYDYVRPPVSVMPGEVIEAEFAFALPHLPDGQYSVTVSVADGDPSNHVQHHWLHDALILDVQSTKSRYGLVGVEVDAVAMRKIVSS